MRLAVRTYIRSTYCFQHYYGAGRVVSWLDSTSTLRYGTVPSVCNHQAAVLESSRSKLANNFFFHLSLFNSEIS